MSGLRNSSVSPEQKRRLISEAVEAAKAQRKRADEAPPPSEWKKKFGSKCKVSPDGNSFELTVREDKDIRAAYEMQEGSRRIDVEQGALAQSRMKRERVIRKGDGRMVEFPEELLEQTKHRFHTPGRNGGAPSVRFGLTDVFEKYEQGPDGLWFVWNGGWEPTSLWRNGAQSPQRDPDLNVWIEVNREWLLDSEVA